MTPFCIIKEKTSFIGMTNISYTLYRSPNEKHSKELTRQEATEIIEKHGLIPVETLNGATLFDTPEKDYLEKYRGYFSRNRKS